MHLFRPSQDPQTAKDPVLLKPVSDSNASSDKYGALRGLNFDSCLEEEGVSKTNAAATASDKDDTDDDFGDFVEPSKQPPQESDTDFKSVDLFMQNLTVSDFPPAIPPLTQGGSTSEILGVTRISESVPSVPVLPSVVRDIENEFPVSALDDFGGFARASPPKATIATNLDLFGSLEGFGPPQTLSNHDNSSANQFVGFVSSVAPEQLTSMSSEVPASQLGDFAAEVFSEVGHHLPSPAAAAGVVSEFFVGLQIFTALKYPCQSFVSTFTVSRHFGTTLGVPPWVTPLGR